MSFSAGMVVLLCACCWLAVAFARSGALRRKTDARDPRAGMRVLRGVLDKRDVPDVWSIHGVRDVRDVREVGGLKGSKRWRGRRE